MDEDTQEEQYKTLVPLDLISKPKLLSVSGNRRGYGAAAFTIKSYNPKTNKSIVDIFVNLTEDLSTTQYTHNTEGVVSCQPVFAVGLSPDATDQLLFLKRGNIFSIPLSGGESIQITDFPLEIQSFKLFQTLDQALFVALVMEVYSDKSPSETAAIDKAKSTGPQSSGMLFDKLMVRHWDNWGTYTKRNHVFICPVEITSSGLFSLNVDHAQDLMFGLEADCPGKAPGQGEEDYAVSPAGDKVALAFRRVESDGRQKADMAWSTDISIFLADLSATTPLGRGSPLTLVSGHDWQGYNSQPSFSPDGSKLAFLSMASPQYESDKNVLRVLDLEAGVVTAATAAIDLSFQSIEWGLTGSTSIYSTAQFRGSSRIFRLKLAEDNSVSALEVMFGDESRSCPVLVPHGRVKLQNPNGAEDLYFLESSFQSAACLNLAVLSDSERASATPVFVPFSSINVAIEEPREVPIVWTTDRMRFIREISVPSPEYVNGDIDMPSVSSHFVRGGGGDLVHLWYLAPSESAPVQEAGSVPLLLIIHGGPQGAIMNSWHYRWNPAVFAAMGYGVVAVNFHGSTGYGQDFCDSIRGDWGGKPYEDCLAAVDYVLAAYPYLDGSRVGALGASYGGYMINWINGHTNRFKCLVNHDGIFSLRSLYYSTEEIFFPECEFGRPWESPEQYDKWSPDMFVSNWSTPTLVIQGGVDFRVGEAESLSTFTALQRKRIPSQLLFFPDENHWVMKPLNSMKWHSTIEAWLKRWLA